MASNTEILNLALGHLASGKEVGNMETEKSNEARIGRRFYDIALDVLVKEHSWGFLTKITTLALVESEPNTEWGYSYRKPSDCESMRRILSGIRNDSRETRVPYKTAQDSSGILIFTDEDDAQLEYTIKATNPQLFTADFTLTFSYLLASLIAPNLTGGDQFGLGAKASGNYGVALSVSIANDINEQQVEELPESEFIRERL